MEEVVSFVVVVEVYTEASLVAVACIGVSSVVVALACTAVVVDLLE